MTDHLGNRIVSVLQLEELITDRFETLCLDKQLLIEPDYFLQCQKHSNVFVLLQKLYNLLVGTNGFNASSGSHNERKITTLNFLMLHSGS